MLDEISKRKGSFSVWMMADFWKFWFETEIEETVNNFSNIEDFYFHNILNLSSYMLDLNLENGFITNCLYEGISKLYILHVN
jgi:hypothetical protein